MIPYDLPPQLASLRREFDWSSGVRVHPGGSALASCVVEMWHTGGHYLGVSCRKELPWLPAATPVSCESVRRNGAEIWQRINHSQPAGLSVVNPWPTLSTCPLSPHLPVTLL